jgi:TorA maturation chaperone TorD
MYTLLSRIFIQELSVEDIAKLRAIVEALPERQRAKVLDELSRFSDEDLYLRLRVDYTKTFILYVHPYESVFLDSSGLLCTDRSAEVKRFYLMAGYEPSLAEARVRCFDHIGLELGFMAKLIEDGRVELQYRFLRNHLARWAPVLGIVVSEVASTAFYRAMGELLAEFVVEDYRYLKGLGVRA